MGILGEQHESWPVDPSVRRLLATIIGLAVSTAVIKVLQRVLAGRIQDRDSRHRVGKVLEGSGGRGQSASETFGLVAAPAITMQASGSGSGPTLPGIAGQR